MMSSVRASILIGLLTACSAVADTTFVSDERVSGHWTAENSPYVILNVIALEYPDSLAMDAGVEVLFAGPYGFLIWGTLTAGASAGNRVRWAALDSETLGGWMGASFETGSSARLTRVSITDVTAPGGTSAILLFGGSLTLEDCVIGGTCGRGVETFNFYEFSMRGCRLLDNGREPCELMGGGLKIRGGNSAMIEDSYFSGNRACDGGGVYLMDAIVAFTDCHFHDNSGSVWGGAAWITGASAVSFDSCTFTRNHAAEGGGVRLTNPSTAVFRYCVFAENEVGEETGSGYGGGIMSTGDGVALDHCTFALNESYLADGSAIYGRFDEISNCIFAFNGGTAALRLSVMSEIHHGAFFGNTADFAYIIPPDVGWLDRVNANGDSTDRHGNIFLDPRFADAPLGDFHLTEDSPCIDAGDPESPPDPDSTVTDIGAYFYPHGSGIESVETEQPSRFALNRIYPNPFNAAATIEFVMPQAGRISLAIYDVIGRRVATLVSESRTAGIHRARWNAEAVPTGVYFAVLQGNDERAVQKLILLR